MVRVLKPRGKLCLITELVLNERKHQQYFLPSEIEDTFLTHPCVRIVGGDFDLRIQKSLMDYPVDIDDAEFISVSPHIVLNAGGTVFTSISMFFEKQPS